jgi:hypothetical protein
MRQDGSHETVQRVFWIPAQLIPICNYLPMNITSTRFSIAYGFTNCGYALANAHVLNPRSLISAITALRQTITLTDQLRLRLTPSGSAHKGGQR